RLVTILGGDLSLHSVPGEGTTVTVRVPAHRPLAGLGLGHVVVADDETTRRSLRSLVEGAAGRVSEVPDAASAAGVTASGPPDLILLGPGASAWDVTGALPPETMVVAVTGDPASG